MPEISRFYGIVIRMYFNDHSPPHFYASYGGQEALITIAPLGVLRGELPPKALALVMEWAALHQPELAADWQLARASRPLNPIEELQ